MPKLTGFDNVDRFNLTISLIAYLYNIQEDVTIADAAAHFKCTEKDIRRAATDINRIAPDVGSMENGMAFLDLDALDEGVLSILSADYLTEVPKISVRQAAALVSGLSYLATMPGFEGDPDLKSLMELLAANQNLSTQVVTVDEVEPDPDVVAIRQALLENKRIRCDYHSQSGVRRVRELEPIRLDPRPDHWYLRAWCPENEEVRTFRLDRMKDAEVIDTPIGDVARNQAALEDALYVSKETDTDVIVEVDPEAYRLIGESAAIEEMVAKGNNKGTVRATIKVGYLPNIGHLISRYGGAARVIAPEEAKEYVRAYAEAALGIAPAESRIETD